MICFIDFETNGFKGSSVLSVTAIREDGEKFVRFYYPKEEFNQEAIAINGLNENKIAELRNGANYAMHFEDDKDFVEFMAPVDKLVAHNIAFDYNFIPEVVKKHINGVFCTMKANTKYFENGKWPKLEKTAQLYGIELKKEKLHTSEYDTLLCKMIFEKMKPEDIEFHFDWLHIR